MYDAKCYELAEHFLPSGISEDLKMALAQHIQDAVNEWTVDTALAIQEALNPDTPKH